ncbi:hypothetical protein M426DRAFT_9990 [Hypoxylon sp. CI-4A]|nr:hypothetical protein M426DRAFT_9990 [Hypoxylon sp. CI-4A]
MAQPTTSASSPARPTLQVLYPDPKSPAARDAEIDIVAIHGLGSNADWAWVWKDESRHVRWLQDDDMLPSVVPNARILLYSYDSRWHHTAPHNRLETCGEDLVTKLHDFRSDALNRPILFVAHSLGGLVVLFGLVYAHGNGIYRYLPRRTAGFIALGTPFNGTNIQLFANITTRFLAPFGSNNEIIRDLKPDNTYLRDKVQRFGELKDELRLSVWCFFERNDSDYWKKLGLFSLTRARVVEEKSAHVLGWDRTGLDTDHFGLNKFSGPNDPSFVAVSGKIRDMCRKWQSTSTQQNTKKSDPKTLVALHTLLHFMWIDFRRQKIELASSPKTCAWILDTDTYKDWVSSTGAHSHHGFFWIKGKPGSGKSVLVKFLFNESAHNMPDTTKFSFFFNARGEELERTTLGLYRALLWGIIDEFKDLIQVLDGVNLELVQRNGWEEQHVKNLLRQAIENLGNRPIICFSSRPYPNIHIGKGLSLDLNAQGEHRADIEHYVRSRLDRRVESTEQEQYIIQIQDDIIEKSNGIFLHAGLVTNMVERAFDYGKALPRQVKELIDGLPTGLSALYRDMLTRNLDYREQEYVEETRLCLLWVLLAKYRLKEHQLYYGIQFGLHDYDILSDNESGVSSKMMHLYILNSSKGLVERVGRDSEDSRTQFIHESVRDFLLSEDGYKTLWSSLSGSLRGRGHDLLKEICLKRVRIAVDQSALERKKLWNSFFLYAVECVLWHANEAESYAIHQQRFLSEFPVEHWIRVGVHIEWGYDSFLHGEGIPTHKLLYMLVIQGLLDLVRIHPDRLRHMELTIGDYGSPLLVALDLGEREVARYLGLQVFVEQNLSSLFNEEDYEFFEEGECFGRKLGIHRFSTGEGLLVNLASFDCVSAVKVMHFQGKEPHQRGPWEGLLSTASTRRSWRVFKWLLSWENNDSIALGDVLSRPLRALCMDYVSAVPLEILQLYLTRLERCPGYIDERDPVGRTPFSYAAERGNDQFLKALLPTGFVDVDSKCNDGRSPLSYAVEQQNFSTIDWLLSLRTVGHNIIDLDSRDKFGRTPLRWAVEKCSLEIVQRLVSTDKVDTGLEADDGLTPLAAAERGARGWPRYKAIEAYLRRKEKTIHRTHESVDSIL